MHPLSQILLLAWTLGLAAVGGFFSPLVAQVAQVSPPARAVDPNAVAYRISVSDKLSISVFGEPELTVGNKRVEGTGMINLNLIQEIRVAGLTVREAQNAIETAYRGGRYLRTPQVSINIDEYAPRVVHIHGKVINPGQHILPSEGQMTVKDLVLKAGGLSDTAKGSEVKIARTLPDGTVKILTIDVDSLIRGKDKARAVDQVLEANDSVHVPEKMF